LIGLLTAFTTTTTIASFHRGSVLPEARVIVIAVPLTLFSIYWFVLRKRGSP
jgi:hypothetical protein